MSSDNGWKPKTPTVTHFDPESSLTRQEDLPRSNIVNIIDSFRRKGVMPQVNERRGSYRDVSEFTNLKDILNQSLQAERDFMRFPARFREIFANDHLEWLSWDGRDPEIRRKLEKAGYIDPADPDLQEPRQPGSSAHDGPPAPSEPSEE